MENETQLITVPSCTKSELAQLFTPHVALSTALRHFNKWLWDDVNLARELKDMGVSKHTRRYSPRQVQTILRYMRSQ